ncbi:WhiB family transcriptional regulator [Rhodococcus sp. JT-3]|uniref:WhiB family transcriptional regulator n=1 Tax=Rhodococcus sp. JT-3 TaxID=1973213 RepID=UPI001303CF25
MDSAEVQCRSSDPDLWFSSVRSELLTAIAWCRKCSRFHQCLTGALDRQEVAGIWGGRHIVGGRIATLPGTTRRYSAGRLRFHAPSKAP